MGVNSLPKTVTRQRRDCDLNPGPSAPESSRLTTRLPSHPFSLYCPTKMTTSRKSWRGPSILLMMLLFRPGSFSSNVHQHRVLRTRLGEAARRRHHKLHSTFVRHDLLLPARRYASAGTSHDPVSVSVSVCLLVTSRCSIKRDERINLVLARGLLSTSPIHCFKDIQVSTKIRVHPSGSLS